MNKLLDKIFIISNYEFFKCCQVCMYIAMYTATYMRILAIRMLNKYNHACLIIWVIST